MNREFSFFVFLFFFGLVFGNSDERFSGDEAIVVGGEPVLLITLVPVGTVVDHKEVEILTGTSDFNNENTVTESVVEFYQGPVFENEIEEDSDIMTSGDDILEDIDYGNENTKDSEVMTSGDEVLEDNENEIEKDSEIMTSGDDILEDNDYGNEIEKDSEIMASGDDILEDNNYENEIEEDSEIMASEDLISIPPSELFYESCVISEIDPNSSPSSEAFEVRGIVDDCASECASETLFKCSAYTFGGPGSYCVLHGKIDKFKINKKSGMKRTRWKKVLYEHSGYPDNYYEPSEFLKGLQTNVNVIHYTLYEAISGASYLASQVNVCVLYFGLFELVQMSLVSFRWLLMTTLAVSGFCFICYLLLNLGNVFSKDSMKKDLQTLVTLVCLGYGFTPIFRTLTTTISTDSIYIMASVLFMVSLVFHNYGMNAPLVNSAFSLNLALAASICLISRLDSDGTAFCFLSLALCGFCFWPNLRNQISNAIPSLTCWVLTVVLTPASVLAVSFISMPLAGLHILEQIFILFICPGLLVAMQHLKSTIHGPWDEATLNIKKYE